jgi:DNA-binding Lrp family transcriptional regulator
MPEVAAVEVTMSSEQPLDGAEPGRLAGPLDGVDRAIIAELVRDGRIAIRTLAEKVHVSRANAYARVARMRADGVIAGFAARLNPERAGLGTSAYVMLSIEQNMWRTVAEKLREVPYVEHFALVGGDFDILILVRASDNATLRHVVLESVQEIPGVRSTRTWLVFDEVDGPGADWAVDRLSHRSTAQVR